MATRKQPDVPIAEAPSRVVGLGASAGGPDALERFFTAVPEKSGLAFVVIQHLSPDHRSWMRDVLSRVTHIPVRTAEEGMRAEADTVTLLPPGHLLRIEAGRLRLTPSPTGAMALPVDVFFRSLAEDQGDRAVGIVLSGAGSPDLCDGTRGVRAIKEAGGLVMVQSEDSAHFVSMPHGAIATGLADFVLPPESMPGVLTRLARSGVGIVPVPLTHEATREHLLALTGLLEKQCGINFDQYKSSTVLRRIERRMHVQQVPTIEEYVKRATANPNEVVALSKDLLISVTRFFRDPDAFDVLQRRVIPQIVDGTRPNEAVRVWVPACATGEEAYSVAMLFLEYRETFSRSFEIKIFGTDVDRDAIAVASAATYPASIVADIGPERLQRFFVRTAAGWQANRLLRQSVIFAPHNALRDPPFTRMDLICCRNMLIYLEPEAQRKLLHVFHFALRPSRFLFLGSSETIGELSEQFRPVEGKWKIFQRTGDARSLAADSVALTLPPRSPLRRSFTLLDGDTPGDAMMLDIARVVLISEFAPLALLMSESYELLHLFNDPTGLLRHPPGDANLSVQKLLPRPLAGVLSAAAHKAIRGNDEVIYRDVRVRHDATTDICNLRVRPIADPTGRRLLLVMVEITQKGAAVAVAADAMDPAAQVEERLADVHQELQHTKETLQATVAEREIANEELQAANEELLAANEELQSTNEELQSGNEELYTVNAEYQTKIQELSELSADVDNLLRYSDIAAIFLDPDLVVRRFTPGVTTLVNLMPRDIGRPFRHISLNFSAPDLAAEVRRVQQERLALERTIQTREGRTHLMRILPYVSEGSGAKGVVITFQDVSATSAPDARMRRALDRIPGALATADATGRITYANAMWGETGFALIGEDVLAALRAHGMSEADIARVDAVCAGREQMAEGLPVRVHRLFVDGFTTTGRGALLRLAPA